MAIGVAYASLIVLFTCIVIVSGSQYHHTGQNVISCTKRKKDYRAEKAYRDDHGLK